MPRIRKELKVLTTCTYRLNATVVGMLDQYCRTTGRSRQFVVEDALRQYLASARERQRREEQLAAEAAARLQQHLGGSR